MDVRFWKSAGLHLVQQADNGWLASCLHRLGNAIHARLSAMAGAKRIVDIDVGESRDTSDVVSVIPLFLSLVKPHILQQ